MCRHLSTTHVYRAFVHNFKQWFLFEADLLIAAYSDGTRSAGLDRDPSGPHFDVKSGMRPIVPQAQCTTCPVYIRPYGALWHLRRRIPHAGLMGYCGDEDLGYCGDEDLGYCGDVDQGVHKRVLELEVVEQDCLERALRKCTASMEKLTSHVRLVLPHPSHKYVPPMSHTLSPFTSTSTSPL